MAEGNEIEVMIRGIKNNFYLKTGKQVKLTVCDHWAGKANFTCGATFDEIVLMVMDCTGWKWDNTYIKSRFPEPLFRRGLIDYIAVHNGETILNCGRKTDRDHTTVINSLKKFEERLETEGYVRQAFDEVVAFCIENYYLYKGKTLESAD